MVELVMSSFIPADTYEVWSFSSENRYDPRTFQNKGNYNKPADHYHAQLPGHHRGITTNTYPALRNLIESYMSEQAGNTGPEKERARDTYLSPLILNHASAHCRCAAPSSSLQQQPSRITSDPGAADPPPSSGPSWQIRHPTPTTSMTTAPVGSTAAAIGGEAPATVGAAATASRRMRGGSGSGQRARASAAAVSGGGYGNGGVGREGGAEEAGAGIKEGAGRVGGARWLGRPRSPDAGAGSAEPPAAAPAHSAAQERKRAGPDGARAFGTMPTRA